MRLLTFTLLPVSLIAISLGVATSAAAPETREERASFSVTLTPEDFDSTTASGTWFIEFFSPFCPHCRRFAPTWDLLADDVSKIPGEPVRMAQLNCAVYGDLCNKLDIDGWPKLNMYQEGKFIETFNEPRDLPLLNSFVQKFIPAPTTSAPAPAHTKPSEPINPAGEVLVLNEDNFLSVVKKGRVFVKFFAPWCGHCKKLAPIWVKLASQMKDQLTIAEVDCEAYGPLCRSQDIQAYPMLFYYNTDGAKAEYTGSRKLEQLGAFVERVIARPVKDISDETFDAEVKTNEVVYLLLYSSSDTFSKERVTTASSVLLGSLPVFASNSEALASYLAVDSSSFPVLIAFKDGDILKPAAQLGVQSSVSIDSIKSWLSSHRLPSALQLDEDNFQPIMNPKDIISPLVVIAAVSEKNRVDAKKKLEEIGKQWEQEKSGSAARDVVFTWMDGGKWATWLKRMYGITDAENADFPPVVIADHERLIYYDVEASGSKISLTDSDLISTLDKVLNGSVAYKHSENVAERLAKYINDKLTFVETFVRNNPKKTISIVLLSFVVFALFIRKLLADGDEAPVIRNGKYERSGNEHSRKSNRLD